MNRIHRVLLSPFGIALLLVAGCSSSGGDVESQVSATAPSNSPVPTASDSGGAATGGQLPGTTVAAPLGNPYDFAQGTPDPALLPVADGSVEAQWYRAGDVYAVVYAGLDVGVDACPGNSIGLPTGDFDHVSNAPLPQASCADFATLIENTADQGVQICGERVSYLTLIPSETAGVLFASIEAPEESAGGGGVGLTSAVQVDDPSAVPEVEIGLLAC